MGIARMWEHSVYKSIFTSLEQLLHHLAGLGGLFIYHANLKCLASSWQQQRFPLCRSPVVTHSMLSSLLFLCSTLASVHAEVTVYGQTALGFHTSASSSSASTVTPAAYNNTRLVPPAIPNPAPANAFTLTLQQSSSAVNGLSIPHVGGSFWGFSIEMSVISQVRESDFPLDPLLLFFDHFFDSLF